MEWCFEVLLANLHTNCSFIGSQHFVIEDLPTYSQNVSHCKKISGTDIKLFQACLVIYYNILTQETEAQIKAYIEITMLLFLFAHLCLLSDIGYCVLYCSSKFILRCTYTLTNLSFVKNQHLLTHSNWKQIRSYHDLQCKLVHDVF